MTTVFKLKDKCIKSETLATFITEWCEIKNVLLFSKLIEFNLDNAFLILNEKQFELVDSYKKVNSESKLKMNMLKLIVETMDSQERNMYYLSNNGNNFLNIPARSFFRENYKKFEIEFYCHKDVNDNTIENSFLPLSIILNYDGKLLLSQSCDINFAKDVSTKLNAKTKLELVDDFNLLIS